MSIYGLDLRLHDREVFKSLCPVITHIAVVAVNAEMRDGTFSILGRFDRTRGSNHWCHAARKPGLLETENCTLMSTNSGG